MSHKLLVKDRRGEREMLLAGAVSVGRDPRCDISEADPLLSRRHAEFVVVADGVVVRDLDSRNGILVNGKRAREAILRPGDVVQVAHLAVTLLSSSEPDAAPAEAAPDGPGDARTSDRTSVMSNADIAAVVASAGAGSLARPGSPQASPVDDAAAEARAATTVEATDDDRTANIAPATFVAMAGQSRTEPDETPGGAVTPSPADTPGTAGVEREAPRSGEPRQMAEGQAPLGAAEAAVALAPVQVVTPPPADPVVPLPAPARSPVDVGSIPLIMPSEPLVATPAGGVSHPAGTIGALQGLSWSVQIGAVAVVLALVSFALGVLAAAVGLHLAAGGTSAATGVAVLFLAAIVSIGAAFASVLVVRHVTITPLARLGRQVRGWADGAADRPTDPLGTAPTRDLVEAIERAVRRNRTPAV